MTRRRRDSVVAVAVVAVLLGVAVAPFAWPLFPTPDAPGGVANGPTTDVQGVGSGERPLLSPGQRAPIRNGSSGTDGDVSVAILDPQGFAVDNPRIADRVVATRSFWDGRSIENGGHGAHGTASALIVASVAPEADLYLANFNGSRSFRRAVEWAVANEVDVIVAPVSFYGKPNDGSAVASRAVEAAVEAGIPVVVPTGNLARKHWQGTYRGGGRLSFSGDRVLRLTGTAREVEVWARWNETPGDRTDLEIVLLRDDGDGYERVATSTRFESDQVGPNQVLRFRPDARIREPVTNGSYAIAVRGPPNATHRIELYSASHRFARPVPTGSIVTPATADAEGVIAVGAARRVDGSVRALPSSSHGPTNDGRPGVDVVAPGVFESEAAGTLRGSSFAASYAGGVVALLKATEPSLSPARIEAVVESTALPAGAPGVDNATGHGMLNPGGAVAAAGDDGGRRVSPPGGRPVAPSASRPGPGIRRSVLPVATRWGTTYSAPRRADRYP